jgi:hypothetical protein
MNAAAPSVWSKDNAKSKEQPRVLRLPLVA